MDNQLQIIFAEEFISQLIKRHLRNDFINTPLIGDSTFLILLKNQLFIASHVVCSKWHCERILFLTEKGREAYYKSQRYFVQNKHLIDITLFVERYFNSTPVLNLFDKIWECEVLWKFMSGQNLRNFFVKTFTSTELHIYKKIGGKP